MVDEAWVPIERWQSSIVDAMNGGQPLRLLTAAEHRRASKRQAESIYLARLVVDGYELELKRDSIVATRGDDCTLYYVCPSLDAATEMFESVDARLHELERALRRRRGA